jgi:hypothetical protein
MKAKEFRIGNLIKTHGAITTVDARTIFDFNTDERKKEPIPLTKEWLIKFGFEKNGFGSFEYERPRKISIRVKVMFTDDYVYLRQSNDECSANDSLIAIWNKDVARRDMYVHEWQNLFFALTGEELTTHKAI